MNVIPIPYPDELLYSVIARAGVHAGITSPKDLLNTVFENRKVIATPDLPSHITSVSQHYPKSSGLTCERLIYKHTLFPIYAPFVPEKTRKKCLTWLSKSSQGAVHLALGVAASRTKTLEYLRYCPTCLTQQLNQYGEYYWQRIWQIKGADCCQQHGELIDSSVQIHGNYRHQFFEASPRLCIVRPMHPSDKESNIVTKQVAILLNMQPMVSPSYEQWTSFYQHLAQDLGLNKGRQIRYELIMEMVISTWTSSWLKSVGLPVNAKESCWLKGIFRKHRKAFSYLEHIVVMESLLANNWKIDNTLKRVSNVTPVSVIAGTTEVNLKPASSLEKYRVKWKSVVSKMGVKGARHNGFGDCYAWLYRHDKEWLLAINRKFRSIIPTASNRVNWIVRDWQTVRQLVSLRNRLEFDLSVPRWSPNWFIKNLPQSATIEKRLDKLPLTKRFLVRFGESVEDHQIRRLTKALIAGLSEQNFMFCRSKLLRAAGLSNERLRPLTGMFLDKVIGVWCRE